MADDSGKPSSIKGLWKQGVEKAATVDPKKDDSTPGTPASAATPAVNTSTAAPAAGTPAPGTPSSAPAAAPTNPAASISNFEGGAISDKVQIILIAPYNETVAKLKEHFMSDPANKIYEASTTNAPVLARALLPCMIIGSIVQNNDVIKLLGMLKVLGADVKKNRVKCLLLSKIKNQTIIQTFEAAGCHEYIVEPIPERSLKFKIDLQTKAIGGQRRASRRTELARLEAAKTGKGGDETVLKGQAKDGVDNEVMGQKKNEDGKEGEVFVFKGNKVKKEGKKWTMRMKGPDPKNGEWMQMKKTEDGETQWRFMEKGEDPTKPKKKGAYEFTGEKPKFAGGEWEFAGEKPKLAVVDENGKELESKLSADADGLNIGKDAKLPGWKVKDHFNESDGQAPVNDKIKPEEEKKKAGALGGLDFRDFEMKDDDVKKDQKAGPKAGEEEKTPLNSKGLDGAKKPGADWKKKDPSAPADEEIKDSAKSEADELIEGEEFDELTKQRNKKGQPGAKGGELLGKDKEKDQDGKGEKGKEAGKAGADDAGDLASLKPKATGFGKPTGKTEEKDGKKPGINGIKTPGEKDKPKNPMAGLDFRDFEMQDDDAKKKEKEAAEAGTEASGKPLGNEPSGGAAKPTTKPKLGMGVKDPKISEEEAKKKKLDALAGLAMDFGDENADYTKNGLNDKEAAIGGKNEATTEHINSQKDWKGHDLSPEELKRKGKKKEESEAVAATGKKKPRGMGTGGAESDEESDDADDLGDGSRNFLKKKREKDALGGTQSMSDDPTGGRSLGQSGPDKGRKMNAHDSDQEKDDDDGDDKIIELDAVSARMKLKEGADELKFEYPHDHFGVTTGTWEATGTADRNDDGTKLFVFVDPAIRTDKTKTVDSIKVWWVYRGEARPMYVIAGKKWVCKKTEAKKIEGFSNLSAGTQAFLLSISPAATMKRKAEAAEKLKAEVEEKKKAKEELAKKRAEEAVQLGEKTAAEKKKKQEESLDALGLKRKKAAEENASSSEAAAEKKKARTAEENAAADAALEQKIKNKEAEAAAEEAKRSNGEGETLDLSSGKKLKRKEGEAAADDAEAETEEAKKKREKATADGLDFSGSGMIETEKMNTDGIDPFADAQGAPPGELLSLLDKAIEQAPIPVIPVRLPSSPMVAVVLSEMLMFSDGKIAEAVARYFTFLSGCFGGARLALFSLNGRMGRCISSNYEAFPLEHEEDFSKTMLAKDAIDKRTTVEHLKTAGTIYCAVTSPLARGVAPATIGLLIVEPQPPAKSMAGNARYLHGIAQCLRGPVDHLGREAWSKPRKKAA